MDSAPTNKRTANLLGAVSDLIRVSCQPITSMYLCFELKPGVLLRGH